MATTITAPTIRQITTAQGDTLSYICWRHYKRSSGVFEQVLNANPHLANFGDPVALVFNAGITITLPVIDEPNRQAGMVHLWD